MLRNYSKLFLFFFLTLLTVICCDFFLVINVLIVSHFRQKLNLLNALNVNVDVLFDLSARKSPKSIKDSPDVVSVELGRHFINFVKRCPQRILHCHCKECGIL